MTDNNPKKSPTEFAQSIKAKYPEYKDIEDSVLVDKIIQKYPQYKESVDFSIKKKENSNSTSENPNSVSGTKATSSASSKNKDNYLYERLGEEYMEANKDKPYTPAKPLKANYGKRNDGTNKDVGFLGELKMNNGSVMTENAIGVNIEGKEVEIPTVVPTLTQSEINWLMEGNNVLDRSEIAENIIQKAVNFAHERKSKGKPFFYNSKKENGEIIRKKTNTFQKPNTPFDNSQFKLPESQTQTADVIYDRFQKETSITPDEKARVKADLDAEINNEGAWNNVVNLAKDWWNGVFSQEPGVQADKNPLIDNMKSIKKDPKHKGITDTEATKLAYEMEISKRENTVKESKARDFLADAQNTKTPDGLSYKDKLETLQKTKLQKIEPELTTLESKHRIFEDKVQSMYSRLDELQSLFEKNKKEGIEPSNELIEEYNSIISNGKNIVKEADDNFKRLEKLSEEKGNLSYNLDLMKRDYGKWSNFSGRLQNSALRITSGIVGAFDYGLNSVDKVAGTNQPIKQLTKLVSKEIDNKVNIDSEKLIKPIGVDDIESASDFGRWFFYNVAAEQAPILATTMIPYVGVGLVGASSMGQKHTEMQTEIANGAKYSDAEQALVPFAYGAAETVGAYVDKLMIGRASSVFKSASASERSMISNGMAKEFLKSTGKSMTQEGIEEPATQLFQNVLDKSVLGKDVNVLDGVKDAFASSIMLTGAMNTPGGLRLIVNNAIKPFTYDSKMHNISKEILEFEKILDNKNLTDSERLIISEKLEKAKTVSQDLLKNKIKEIGNLSNEEFSEVLRLEKSQANIRSKVLEIRKSENLTQEEKTRIEKALEVEFKANDNRRVELLKLAKDSGRTRDSIETESTEVTTTNKTIENNEVEQVTEAKEEVEQVEEYDPTEDLEFLENLKVEDDSENESGGYMPINENILPSTSETIPDKTNFIQENELPTQKNNIVDSEKNINLENNSESESYSKDITQGKGSYNVVKDKNGNFSITSKATGKVIPEFIQRKVKSGTKTVKNPTYSKAVALAEGNLTENQINEDNKAIYNEAVKLLSDSISNAYDAVLLSFANGLNISRESVKKETNQKVGGVHWTNSSVAENKLISITQAAHSIWEEHFGVDSEITDQDIRNEIIDVISSFGSRKEIQDAILERYNEQTNPYHNLTEEEQFNEWYNSLNEDEKNFYDSKLDIELSVEQEQNLSTEEQIEFYNKLYERTTESLTETERGEFYGGVQTESELSENVRFSESSRTQEESKNSRENGRNTSILDRISQEERGSGNEVYRRFEEFRDRLGERSGASETKLTGPLENEDINFSEKKFAWEYSKENDLFIENFEALGSHILQGGQENSLVLNSNEKTVYKSNNLRNKQGSISNLFESVEIHNELFPHTSYEVIGFTGKDIKNIEVVLKQNYIVNTEQASENEIKNYMESLGFIQTTHESFVNENYLVFDLYPRNVLKDSNGTLFVVDAEFKKVENTSNTENLTSLDLATDEQLQALVDEKSLIDKMISQLDTWEKRLDKFGKETLGVAIPLVVAKETIKAMKLAAKTAKAANDIVKAGLDYLKTTDWYNNLSKADQKKINLRSLKNLVAESIREIKKAEKVIEKTELKLSDIRQKLADQKATRKEVISLVTDFLKDNKVNKNITPTEVNRLIREASRILTKADPLKAFDQFVDSYNRIISKGEQREANKLRDKTEPNRSKVIRNVERQISQGKSKEDIINSFEEGSSTRMVAEDYFERKQRKSDDEIRAKTKKLEEDYLNKRFEKKPISERVKKAYTKFIEAFFDRANSLKNAMNGAGMKYATALFIATKGAPGYANYLFNKAYQEIFEGLSTEQTDNLNMIIRLRRIIAIENDTNTKGKDPMVHAHNFNLEQANQALNILEQDLGPEEYKNLKERADKFFKQQQNLLKQMHEAGVLSTELYNDLKGIEYIKTRYLDFLSEVEENSFKLEQGASTNVGLVRLSDGWNGTVEMNAAELLAQSIQTTTKAIASNRLNIGFIQDFNENKANIEQLKTKTDLSKAEQKAIDDFKNIEDKIVITDNVNTKTPRGFSKITYFENGEQKIFFMEDSMYKMYSDNVASIWGSGKVKDTIATYSGNKLLKAVATGKNPTFFITNTPRDFFWIAATSKEYSKLIPLAWGQLAVDFVKGSIDVSKDKLSYQKAVEYGLLMDFLHLQGDIKFNLDPRTKLAKTIKVLGDNVASKSILYLWEKGMVLGKYSEVGFRMAIFNKATSNGLNEFNKANGTNFKSVEDINESKFPSAKEKIYTNAVVEARESTVDFNQGGHLSKDIEALIPYFNAGTQGTRMLVEKIAKDPIRTVNGILQTTGILVGSTISLSLAMLSALQEDDDDRDVMELYNEFYSGISEFDRANYLVFPVGKEDGEYRYSRIAIPQALTPFFSFSRGVTHDALNAMRGIEGRSYTFSDTQFSLDKNVIPFELSTNPIKVAGDNVSKIPTVKAAMSYVTGYDFFREQQVSNKFGKVDPSAEGYESKSIEGFYKEFGYQTGASPARLKVATEALITTPSTNIAIGGAYGVLNTLFSKDPNDKSFGELALKSFGGRIMKTTSDFNRKASNTDEFKDAKAKNDVENAKSEYEAKSFVDKYHAKEISRKEAFEGIKEVFGDDKRRLKNYNERLNKNYSKFSGNAQEIKFADADKKALLLKTYFGSDLFNQSKLDEKQKELKRELIKLNVLTPSTKSAYIKEIKNK